MIIISAHKFTELCNCSVIWCRFTNFPTMFAGPYCLSPPNYATIIFDSEIIKNVSSSSPTSCHDFSHAYACARKCMYVCVYETLIEFCTLASERKQFFYLLIFIPPHNCFFLYSYIIISLCYLVLMLWFKGSWVNDYYAINYSNGIATI